MSGFPGGVALSDLSLVEVRTYSGFTYRLALPAERRDVHELNLAQTGAFCHVQEVLQGLCAPGALMIDIGANVGSVALPLAMRGVRVLAYDVLPENIAAIELGAAGNGVADLVRTRLAAVWHETTDLPIVSSNTLATVKYDTLDQMPNRTTPAVRLDDELGRAGAVTAIKIDVEGAELNVLRGAERILAEQHPHILFEVYPIGLDCFGATAAELFDYLSGHGYDLYRIAKPVLSPGCWPPAEQVVVDYLATVMPPEELAARTRYKVRKMKAREIIAQIKLQSTLLRNHRRYVLAIQSYLPEAVQADPEVRALLRQWAADFPDPEEIAQARRATIGR